MQNGILVLFFVPVLQVTLAIIMAKEFGTSGEGTFPKTVGDIFVILICLFVAGFAWSWGPLGWLIPSEVCPLEIRSAGQATTVSTNMLFTFFIAQCFLTMLCHLKYGIFLFFAFFTSLMTLFVVLFLPETKNVPIEEMNRVLKEHWFWGKYITDDALIGKNRSIELSESQVSVKTVEH